MRIEKYRKEMMIRLRWTRVHATVANALSTIVGMLVPYLIGKGIDGISDAGAEKAGLAVAIIATVLFNFLLNWYQNYQWFKMIYNGQTVLRGGMFGGIAKNSYQFWCGKKSGDVVNRLINDAAQYAEGCLISVPMLILNGFTLVVAFVLIFQYSVPIGIVIMAICLVYFFSYRYINVKLRKYSGEERKGYSELVQTTTQFYEGIPTIQLFGKEDFFAGKYREKVNSLGERNIRLQLWKSLAQSLSGLIIDLMPVAAVVMGMYLVVTGKCSVGAIFGIYAYTSYLGEPIRNLTDLNIIVQQGKINGERLEELLAEEELPVEQVDSLEEVALKNICISYDGQNPVLKNFDLSIRKGERIGIVGGSGCGKSTLTHVLTGELLPGDGQIFVNGREADPAVCRTRIAVLPQDIFLYDDSVLENIRFGREQTVPEDIVETLAINKFADRDIRGLSGGEKRRVGLARALAGDFDLLILDEPTAEIDERMEERIIRFIDQALGADKMLVVITHRPRILEVCSRTIRMEA